MLEEYRSIAESKEIPFFQVDGKDAIFSERLFLKKFVRLFKGTDKIDFENIIEILQYGAEALNEIAETKRVVLVIDSYEQLKDFDVQIKEFFISRLSRHVLIIIVSVYSLPFNLVAAKGRTIDILEVETFSYQEVVEILSSKEFNKKTIDVVWELTKGHALSIALALSLLQARSEHCLRQIENGVVQEMGRYWYTGLSDSKLKDLVSVSSLLFEFNQELLEFVLETNVSKELFDRLTTLSFCRPSNKGWQLHDLVKDAIKTDLQRRRPSKYNDYIRRCATYYYRVVKTEYNRKQDVIMEYFYYFYYYTGNETLHDTYFKGIGQSSNYYEPYNNTMDEEVQNYIKERGQKVPFSDELLKQDGLDVQEYKCIIKKDFEMLCLKELYSISKSAIRLLRDRERNLIGISVIIPLDAHQEFFAKQPVISPFLNSLSKKEKASFNGCNDESKCWFIRLHESIAPIEDATVRADMLRYILSFLAPNRLLVTTTPFRGLSVILEELGFRKIPGVIHDHYGKKHLAPVLILDLRGEKFQEFLDIKMKKAGFPLITFPLLTKREQEVAKKLLLCKSNDEIAEELFISIVTVKKHIGSILKKTGTKNRAEFIRYMMEEPS